MTAEIAVLNKSAVALATDSAVTISSGDTALKIFESADKLFELTCEQPIGIMIYNGMQFLGVPFDTIIKSFRKKVSKFETVDGAAQAFLSHLYQYVDGAPEEELYNSIVGVIGPIASQISHDIERKTFDTFKDIVQDDKKPDETDFQSALDAAIVRVLDEYDHAIDQFGEAEFIPRTDNKRQSKRFAKLIKKAVEENISEVAQPSSERIFEICTRLLKSNHISRNKTGLVFAGFGETEIFPTLISFEIDSVFEMKIRRFVTEHCDIDRKGRRALVRPFAQKEMVDRFLHGLDDRLRDDITFFCKQAIHEVSEGIISSLNIEDAEKSDLEQLAKRAEKAFIEGLSSDAFTSFQDRSRTEIESMVEFMPKPELAKMAEALIDLTSIKRKVSQQLETVGGPVDVAVISKNDGFVWVKRKHYFPKELNSRYFTRNNFDTPTNWANSDEHATG